MGATFWKVFALCSAAVVGGLFGMKHQYELEEEWAKKFSHRVRLELEKEIEEEGIVEKMLEMEKENSLAKTMNNNNGSDHDDNSAKTK
ncbi:hypothetical protein FDP41_003090 [Naegleria fowleri]|uniref:Uncharacterized protein n=1 Tax=Naegleria fowleri TaxID=5763 RepID=A0A6A5BV12_NAEFO|nr:uncharacterized protein FDP41_003090 [Naegleria fowleri]KAF0977768.1 hypothetical protein FDP41_003090 [Naegleria fowleri]CAG4710188.1 unnamed protein product [Naegleria fowleri]